MSESRTATGARVVVVGGGLAGITAALHAADAGADVVLVEKRRKLGGLTWSFERKGLVFDNGQHVHLRCCTEYRAFLERIGAADQVHLQPLLDVPVLAPGGRTAHISRSAAPLPPPLHLGPSLLTYRHLSLAERLRLRVPVAALRRLALDDPSLDAETFGAWLAARGQSRRAIERLWDLVVLPTVNVAAADASLALAAKVLRTGLLDTVDGADIGWSAVPLGELHGAHGSQALEAAGVEVLLGTAAEHVGPRGSGALPSAGEGAAEVEDAGAIGEPVSVVAGGRRIDADAVVVALPHEAAPGVLPPGAIGDVRGLGHSPIVNVHLVLDRKVTDLALAAAVGSPVQFVFDHTSASGIAPSSGLQSLVVSLSDAGEWIGQRPEQLVRTFHAALGELFPKARGAAIVDAVVSRERTATFRGIPGTAALRPRAATAVPGVFVAGAWCATGWPATMEGAVRSGASAAAALVASLGSGTARPLEGATA